MRKRGMQWAPSALILGTIIIVSVSLWAAGGGPRDSLTQYAPPASDISLPDCGPGTPTAQIKLTVAAASGLSLDSPCYYAVAGQELQVKVTNDVVVGGDQPLGCRIVIAPIATPAVNPISMGDSSREQFWAGSTENAVFVTERLIAPETETFPMDALTPGTYVVQIWNAPQIVSELVVS